MTWKPDLTVQATDIFQIHWLNLARLYAFLTFALIGSVLAKVRTKKTSMMLIIPNWAAQLRFSQWLEILKICRIRPILLLQFKEFLNNPKGQIHPLVQDWSLRLEKQEILRKC